MADEKYHIPADTLMEAMLRGASVDQVAKKVEVSIVSLLDRMGGETDDERLETHGRRYARLLRLRVEGIRSKALDKLLAIAFRELDEEAINTEEYRAIEMVRRTCISLLQLNMDRRNRVSVSQVARHSEPRGEGTIVHHRVSEVSGGAEKHRDTDRELAGDEKIRATTVKERGGINEKTKKNKNVKREVEAVDWESKKVPSAGLHNQQYDAQQQGCGRIVARKGDIVAAEKLNGSSSHRCDVQVISLDGSGDACTDDKKKSSSQRKTQNVNRSRGKKSSSVAFSLVGAVSHPP